MQPILSDQPKRPGRQGNGGIIASGTPIHHGGRIAGGAPDIANPALVGTFAPIVYRSPAGAGASPGGLVDKAQQANPRSTNYVHPFSGGKYFSINSQQLLPGLGHWNGFITPYHDVPSNQPHERGTFFQNKITPTVKTQFGARMSGPRPDTAFHRNPKVHIARGQVRTAIATEHISRELRPPSFESFNHLTGDPTNFNSLYGHGGRWGNLKRSAQEVT